MGKERALSDRHTIPVSVALRPFDLSRISYHTRDISRSAFIRRAIANELAMLEGSDKLIHFDAAGFLDHHWFENGLVSMSGRRSPNARKSGINSNMTWASTLDMMYRFTTSLTLDSPVKDHIPTDIMNWLERYMKPLEEEMELLNDEDAANFVQIALNRYRELARKYGAH